MEYALERMPDGTWALDGVWKRGSALLQDSLLNKGTAFSASERNVFELEGLLPNVVNPRHLQVRRAYEHITAKGDNPLEKYIGMMSLLDRNETLFYQVLLEHLVELVPVVYTPTVGLAAVRFSHVFRRGRGLWITPDHRGRIYDVLGHVRGRKVRLVVATDNERILGLGDQGAGGMVIPIGKLALYTLAAGIHPAFTLPISLDVGTDNEELLADDLYVGWRHPRLRGEPYQSLVAEFVDALRRRWPDAVLQWEDFKKGNAFRLLDKHRDSLPSFNDDIQGTAAVVVAGIASYCRATNTKFTDHRFMLVGAGAAGVGIGRLLRHKLAAAGSSADDIHDSVVMFDTHGLVTDDRSHLESYKRPAASSSAQAKQWGLDQATDLVGAVSALRPTVLIGTTGQHGLFTDAVLRKLAHHASRPLVMALSNPTSKCEATPRDIIASTNGRAVVAIGSPFDPVTFQGRQVAVNQCNNVYIFPGVGLGAIATGARAVTDGMFATAAAELAAQVEPRLLSSGYLYPPLTDLRSTTRRIAVAVAQEAITSGVAPGLEPESMEAAVDEMIWDLEYPILRAV